MYKKIVFMIMAVFVLSGVTGAIAQNKELSKDELIAVATEEVKSKGIDVEGVTVVYDEGNKLWAETLGKATVQDESPNYGILKKGFLKNYRTVYFDFKEPLPDIWVFIDKDTGEVLEVYTGK